MATSDETDGGRAADKDWLEGRRNLGEETFAEAMDRSGGEGREPSSLAGRVVGRTRGALATATSLLTRRT